MELTVTLGVGTQRDAKTRRALLSSPHALNQLITFPTAAHDVRLPPPPSIRRADFAEKVLVHRPAKRRTRHLIDFALPFP